MSEGANAFKNLAGAVLTPSTEFMGAVDAVLLGDGLWYTVKDLRLTLSGMYEFETTGFAPNDSTIRVGWQSIQAYRMKASS